MTIDLAGLIDDRPEDGTFRVNRALSRELISWTPRCAKSRKAAGCFLAWRRRHPNRTAELPKLAQRLGGGARFLDFVVGQPKEGIE